MKEEKLLVYFFPALFIAFVISGLALDGWHAASDFLQLQLHPARLINDFFVVSGTGAALINSAVVGLIGYLLIVLTGTSLSGPTFAAVLTMMGFGLFGKTPLNIVPVIAGVYLAARYALKTFKEYIIIALFGTALGPLMSTIAFEIGLPAAAAVPAGVLGGLVAGFFLPSIAVTMLNLHQGYNLYNMGMTCGFVSLFAAALIKASGHGLGGELLWSTENGMFELLLIPVLSAVLIAAGLLRGPAAGIRNLLRIQKLPGRLPSDFIDYTSLGGAFINSGLIGLAGSAFVLLSGGEFNGPAIGGLLTIMGFAAFGTHLKNSWPVAAGVVLAALLFGKPLSSPGVQLAVIFGTTLSPIAGQFGIIPGMIAGFLHLVVVSQTGSWQGGINLYNNGFSGGLTASLVVAVVQWYRSNRKDNLTR